MGSVSGNFAKAVNSTGNLDDNLSSIREVLDEYTGVESGKW